MVGLKDILAYQKYSIKTCLLHFMIMEQNIQIVDLTINLKSLATLLSLVYIFFHPQLQEL
jgi:hypothetical protein